MFKNGQYIVNHDDRVMYVFSKNEKQKYVAGLPLRRDWATACMDHTCIEHEIYASHVACIKLLVVLNESQKIQVNMNTLYIASFIISCIFLK